MTRAWLLVALFACGAAPVAPTPRACLLHTTTWRDQPSVLRLADGTPFVDVVAVTDAQVTLDARAHVTLRTPAITVRGFVDALNLHATAPFLVDYAVPGPKVPLRFVAARGDVTFELAVPFTQATLRGTQPCRALGLDDTATFAPRRAVAAPTLREAYVHADRAIALGGATLRFAESPRADVLEERGDRARVAIYSDALDPAADVMIVGWIPKAALGAEAHGFGGSWATGGDRMPARERPAPGAKLLRCPQDVPLDVEVAGKRETVGTIRANAVIELAPDDTLRIRDSGALLVEGARWLVAKPALAGCEAIRP